MCSLHSRLACGPHRSAMLIAADDQISQHWAACEGEGHQHVCRTEADSPRRGKFAWQTITELARSAAVPRSVSSSRNRPPCVDRRFKSRNQFEFVGHATAARRAAPLPSPCKRREPADAGDCHRLDPLTGQGSRCDGADIGRGRHAPRSAASSPVSRGDVWADRGVAVPSPELQLRREGRAAGQGHLRGGPHPAHPPAVRPCVSSCKPHTLLCRASQTMTQQAVLWK